MKDLKVSLIELLKLNFSRVKRASLLALLLFVGLAVVGAANVSAVSGGAFSSSTHQNLCSGFLPDNGLSYPVGATFNGALSGLAREQYDGVLDKIDSIYGPMVKQMGGTFTIFRDWENPGLSSSAGRGRAEIAITIFGGIARHPSMTEDGLALVACHEIGHHFGGFPKLKGRALGWMSVEGQADYYAGLKCLRLYFDEASNREWFKANGNSLPTLATEKCGQVYSGSARSNENLICLRTAMAGLVVGHLFIEVNKDTKPVALETPDTRVVSTTNASHPASQCRVDTYFQSALCDRPLTEVISNTDYRVGTCSQAGGQVIGFRPACWFRP